MNYSNEPYSLMGVRTAEALRQTSCKAFTVDMSNSFKYSQCEHAAKAVERYGVGGRDKRTIVWYLQFIAAGLSERKIQCSFSLGE